MAKNDGGPAFPLQDESFGGMSLRDYFAAAALQGWMASYPSDQTCDGILGNDNAALAYRMADAMLAERAK